MHMGIASRVDGRTALELMADPSQERVMDYSCCAPVVMNSVEFLDKEGEWLTTAKYAKLSC